MATISLVNRYKQYKAGTAKVVDWIVGEASTVRNVSDTLPSMQDTAKQPRKPQTRTSETTIAVNTTQMLDLARLVAHAAVRIPTDIMYTIDTVIAGRQSCYNWYSSLPNSYTAEKDSGHLHFIQLLKDIQQLFRDSLALATNVKVAGKQSGLSNNMKDHAPTSDVSFENMFTRLCVEEPSDAPLGERNDKNKTLGKVAFDIETDEESKDFAIWCLLQDLCDLRGEVRNTWMAYKAGTTSFSTAAAVTEVAISLSRFAEEEFIELHKGSSDYFDILTYLNVSINEIGNDICLGSMDSSESSQIVQEKFDNDNTMEMLMPCAFAMLRAFWFSHFNKWGLTFWASNFSAGSTGYMGFHPFGDLLKEIMPEIELHCKFSTGAMTLDQFLGSLVGMMRYPGNMPTLSMVTACQMNMDITDILDNSIEAGLSDFHMRVEADRTSIYTFLSNWNLKTACRCENSLVTESLKAKDMLKMCAEDPYLKARKSLEDEGPALKRVPQEPFKVHRVLPVATGMLIHISALQSHHLGIRLCNWGNVVLSVAYLYRAALRARVITKTWPDMEFVIKTHSKSRAFVLEPNVGTTSMAKCFGVSLGVKLKAFKKGQRPRLPKPAVVEQYARTLSTDWPLQKAIDAWQEDQTRDIPFVRAAIESMKSLQRTKTDDQKIQEIKDQYQKTGKLSPSQLLLAFQEVYRSDEMDLKFDYIGFFFTCARVLDAVRNKVKCCLAELEKEQEADFTWAHELVYAILWDKMEGPAQHDFHHQHNILPDAAKVVEWVIDQEGSRFTDIVQNQTGAESKAASNENMASRTGWSGTWKGDLHTEVD